MPDPDTQSTAASPLVAGSRVAGTPVYSTTGERLGTLQDIMLDKASGQVAYAVLSFGGFLGIGDKHHPLPWAALRYDTERGGYVVQLDPAQLEGAPVLSEDAEAMWRDRAWGERVHAYWDVAPYWSIMP